MTRGQQHGPSSRVFLGLLLVGLVLGSTPLAAEEPCSGVGLGEGASKADVLQQCGDPSFVDSRLVTETVYLFPDGRRSLHPIYLYPDGRQAPAPRPGQHAAAVTPRPGPSPVGQPQYPRTTGGAQAPAEPPAQVILIPVLVTQPVVLTVLHEEWTYNYGPHRFMRCVHFVDGQVTTIQTLGYGR